jgi:Response regulator containing CheY-like receiver domain and AraC-type DNA-binding domain
MLNVIIVDDELLMRIGLKSMIHWEEHGFHISGEAANGKEALELAARQRTDLIVTDIKMPVMDGLELIRQASGRLEGCKFVILSCLEEFHYAQEAVRLGAIDYLIKSDLKPEQLVGVLRTVRDKLEGHTLGLAGNAVLGTEYKEGLGYLKETLFKELFSGYRSAEEVIDRSAALRIALLPQEMLVVKLRVSRFDDIRRKYVEQDEKLLRYSIVNIIEELVPKRWRSEIVVENSADYLLIMNVPSSEARAEATGRLAPQEALDGLFGKIFTSMKEFLNIKLLAGVSGICSGFGGLRKAYKEADLALRNHFYGNGTSGSVLYYGTPEGSAERTRGAFPFGREDAAELRRQVERGDGVTYLDGLRSRMYGEGVSELGCRKLYLRALSVIASCFPFVPELEDEGHASYERIMKEETLESLHRSVLRFLAECRERNAWMDGPRSYAEQARAIMAEQYGGNISLQSVAGEINVNPSYLSRVFKNETGENFIGYLTRIRIEKAQQLLRNKQLKVYEVAHMTGYPNTAYFSKIFKKATGVTPEEYRG